MHGRWRLFRHETARRSGPGPIGFLALYVAALAVGTVSTHAFDAVVFWPANGVMIAALLLLPSRSAAPVFLICIVLNLVNNVVRGDAMPFFVMNVALNALESFAAAMIVRRVCGAALDLRRPARLLRFTLLAILPTVVISASIAVSLAVAIRGYGFDVSAFIFQRYVTVEVLGTLIVTPALLLLSQAPARLAVVRSERLAAAGLLGLLFAVTSLVFFQTSAPLTFLIGPFLLLVALRLAPGWVATAVIGVAFIAGAATAAGIGPFALTQLPDIPALFGAPGPARNLSVYYLFMLIVVTTALPLSTVTAQRRRLMERLKTRTAAAQLARQRAERSEAAKSRFLALMSHEMRTPLNSIAGYTEILSRRTDLDAEVRRGLDRVRQAGAGMLMLVEDVLDISRGDDTLELGVLTLDRVVATAVAPSRAEAEAKGLTIDIDIRPDAAIALIGDARRLSQALHHLIGNAVKFTPSGGVSILADRLDGDVLIAVTDTGCGLDADRATELFAPFVQGDDTISRKHIGAGVGLSIVARQATAMGGTVTVTSRPDEGSTFTLRLGMERAEAVAPGVMASAPDQTEHADLDDAATGSSKSLQVLVVDDHPSNREVARLMLTAMGCDVTQAEDGDEAVELARHGGYDLILMDVRMPRLDGLSATRAIRALEGDMRYTPILAVTADAMPEDAARCLAAGMDAHLPKPISFAGLSTAMAQVTARTHERTGSRTAA